MRVGAAPGAVLLVSMWRAARGDSEIIDVDGHHAPEAFKRQFSTFYNEKQRAIIFDVGANDGKWTQMVQALCCKIKQTRSIAREQTEFHLFEPQPRFVTVLQDVVRGWPHATHHRAAVWKDGSRNLTFFLSRSSMSASLRAVNAHHMGVPKFGPAQMSVRSIDLAAFMAQRLPAAPDPALLTVLKLDVESAEYELLPHLLTHGILCRVRLLIVEWHLNALPPAERLNGLTLRLSLSSLLDKGCGAMRPQVIHESSPVNNYEQIVPGLWNVLLHHNGTPIPGEQKSSRMVRLWDTARRRHEDRTRHTSAAATAGEGIARGEME
jgi:FkbM family methyltransferase